MGLFVVQDLNLDTKFAKVRSVLIFRVAKVVCLKSTHVKSSLSQLLLCMAKR